MSKKNEKKETPPKTEIKEPEPAEPEVKEAIKPIIKAQSILCQIDYDLVSKKILKIHHNEIEQIILDVDKDSSIITRLIPRSNLLETLLREIKALSLRNLTLLQENTSQRQVNFQQLTTSEDAIMMQRQHSGSIDVQADSWIKQYWKPLFVSIVAIGAFSILIYLLRANPSFTKGIQDYIGS